MFVFFWLFLPIILKSNKIFLFLTTKIKTKSYFLPETSFKLYDRSILSVSSDTKNTNCKNNTFFASFKSKTIFGNIFWNTPTTKDITCQRSRIWLQYDWENFTFFGVILKTLKTEQWNNHRHQKTVLLRAKFCARLPYYVSTTVVCMYFTFKFIIKIIKMQVKTHTQTIQNYTQIENILKRVSFIF